MPRLRPFSVAAVTFLLAALLAAPVAAQDADLIASKLDSLDPLPAGATQTYTLTVTNNGPDDAEFVTLFDTLPAGTTFVSFTAPAGWTCTTPPVGMGGDVDCSTGLLAAFTAPSFTLQVVFDAGLANGTLVTNTATVSAETSDPNPGNEDGVATTTVGPFTAADLTVTKSDSPDPVLAGGALTYTISVINNGPADAATVTMLDSLPPNVGFQSVLTPAGWSCLTPPVGSAGDVECTTASLPPGSALLTLGVTVDPAATPGTVVANSVLVSSSTEDPNPKNQSAGSETTVAAPPALTATKTVAGTFTPGGAVTYTFVLANEGDVTQGDNPGDELVDTLPAAVALVGATANAGTATANLGTNTVSWNGALAAGASVTVTVDAQIDAAAVPGTVIANQGALSFDGDGDGSNDATGLTDDPSVGGAADPTELTVVGGGGGGGPNVVEIPTAGSVALLALGVLLALAGARRLRAT